MYDLEDNRCVVAQEKCKEESPEEHNSFSDVEAGAAPGPGFRGWDRREGRGPRGPGLRTSPLPRPSPKFVVVEILVFLVFFLSDEK